MSAKIEIGDKVRRSGPNSAQEQYDRFLVEDVLGQAIVVRLMEFFNGGVIALPQTVDADEMESAK